MSAVKSSAKHVEHHKKKKKKKNKDSSVETSQSDNTCSHRVVGIVYLQDSNTAPNSAEHKSKKKRKQQEEVDDADKQEQYASLNISAGNETKGRHTKKKRKHQDCEQLEGSSNVSVETVIPPSTDVERKAKKKRRKHQEEGYDAEKQEEYVSSNISLGTEMEGRHKEKKRRHPESDPFEEGVLETVTPPSTGVEWKERNKKRKEDDAFGDCSEAASLETGSEQKTKNRKRQEESFEESTDILVSSPTKETEEKQKKKKKKRRDLQQERCDLDSSTASLEANDVGMTEAKRKHKKKKKRKEKDDKPAEREELVDNAANHANGLLASSSMSSDNIFSSVRSRKSSDVVNLVDFVMESESQTQSGNTLQSVSQQLDTSAASLETGADLSHHHRKHKKSKKKKRQYQHEQGDLTKETNVDLDEMEDGPQEAAETSYSSLNSENVFSPLSKSGQRSAPAADLVEFVLESGSSSGKTPQSETCQSHASKEGVITQHSVVDTQRSIFSTQQSTTNRQKSSTSLQQSPGTSRQSLMIGSPRPSTSTCTTSHQSLASSPQSVVNTQTDLFNGESGDEQVDGQQSAALNGGGAEDRPDVQPAGDAPGEEQRNSDEDDYYTQWNTISSNDYKKLMEEQAIRGDNHFKLGRWTKKEIQTLERNWNSFLKEHDITDPNFLLGMFTNDMSIDEKREKRDFIKSTDCYQKLAAGLERAVFSVYSRARRTFGTKKIDAMTKSECTRLRELHRKHEGDWTFIAEEMNRTEKSLQLWWQKHFTDTVKKVKGSWTRSEDQQLLTAIQEEADTDDLSGVLPELSWHVISKSVPTKSAAACRQHWLNKLQAEHKGQPHHHFGSRNMLKLYNCIRDLKVTDQSEIDWDLVEEQMKHVAARGVLQSRWANIKKLVPVCKARTFPEIVEFLTKHQVPKWQAKLQAKLQAKFAR